ncbi:MAG: NADH-quinone oxidoreductase subunit A [Cytophagales bacterium]|nr:NADH-quinone oxidoreductase subunit A [Cytophagales bacterium]
MITTEYTALKEILLFIVGALVFVGIGSLVSLRLRPHRPNTEKLTTYESGEAPTGSAWGKFNTRFYVIALIFMLFEVEIIFLFPWATVLGKSDLKEATAGQWTWFAFLEALLFILILALGLAYVWVKGHLDWVKPPIQPPMFSSKVPQTLYKQVNQRKYPLRKKLSKP